MANSICKQYLPDSVVKIGKLCKIESDMIFLALCVFHKSIFSTATKIKYPNRAVSWSHDMGVVLGVVDFGGVQLQWDNCIVSNLAVGNLDNHPLLHLHLAKS